MKEAATPDVRQVTLRPDQLQEFDFDGFVVSQIDALRTLADRVGLRFGDDEVIVDIGGGHGYFAAKLRELHPRVVVYETDPRAVEYCRGRGLDAELVDALRPMVSGKEKLVCLNLILHHLIGSSETANLRLQVSALSPWNGPHVFVHEYCYQGFGETDVPGWLIFKITSSRLLSMLARVVARWLPSLRANTLGVGVRFRSSRAWLRIFEREGFEVLGVVEGVPEPIPLPRRLLFIKSIRRDSFLLRRRNSQPGK